GIEGGQAQGDGEQDDAPQAWDGVVVASVPAGGVQALEELLVGDGGEEVAEGGEGGEVLQVFPGEQWVGGVQQHDEPPVVRRWRITQRIPRPQVGWGKNPGKMVGTAKEAEKS